MKPPVDLADFQRLDLHVGTVAAVDPHPNLTDLSILTVLRFPGESGQRFQREGDH